MRHPERLLGFYWCQLRSTPGLFKKAVVRVEGMVAAFFFVVLLLSEPVGKRLLDWDGVDPDLATRPLNPLAGT